MRRRTRRRFGSGHGRAGIWSQSGPIILERLFPCQGQREAGTETQRAAPEAGAARTDCGSDEDVYPGWLTALNFQGLGPTGRVNVQYSSNFTGSVLLPLTTWLVRSSTV